MDTMYRRKTQSTRKTAGAARSNQKSQHVADNYKSQVRPRQMHPDAVDSQRRIKGNLKQLNKRLTKRPAAAEEVETTEAPVVNEDRGARIVTKFIASKSKIPYGYILSLALVLGVLMYVLFLFVQVEEYSKSIAEMESRIAELKEESTRLEVQLEGKYDLDEIERVATQEFGMVVSSVLPKKYISVSADEDVWQKVEDEDEKGSLLEQIKSGIRKFRGEDKE